VAGPIALTTPTGAPVRLEDVHGRVNLTADAYDVPPLVPAPPWQNARWTPALVTWRLVRGSVDVIPWRVAADFRTAWLPPYEFNRIFAPGTTKRPPSCPLVNATP